MNKKITNAAIAVLAVLLSGGGIYEATQAVQDSQPDMRDSTVISEEMQVTFLDVGQGDRGTVRLSRPKATIW